METLHMESLGISIHCSARFHGASRVSRGRRKRWLHDIAARLDPPRAIVRSRETLVVTR
jgi:hypothetical protein